MVIGVWLFIAFLVSVAYLTFMQEKHKRSKGISVGDLSAESFLEKMQNELDCPFVKEIRLGKKGSIEFVCKYDTHNVKLEDGSLYIDKLA